jgi:hypothetical protein
MSWSETPGVDGSMSWFVGGWTGSGGTCDT